ncbi:MAG: hypothetical protein ACM3QS_13140 [Bacteroidota bacterium]
MQMDRLRKVYLTGEIKRLENWLMSGVLSAVDVRCAAASLLEEVRLELDDELCTRLELLANISLTDGLFLQ